MLLLLIVWILEVCLYLPSLHSIVADETAILSRVDKYLEGCCQVGPTCRRFPDIRLCRPRCSANTLIGIDGNPADLGRILSSIMLGSCSYTIQWQTCSWRLPFIFSVSDCDDLSVVFNFIALLQSPMTFSY